ncbi:MAG TPA: GNAT family N-acetyltransferase [Arenibacter sp.]|nr:GNAT family N-acetyltransferase [Arenibacter sp.]
MVVEIKTFDELHIRELYQILQLRSEVFVVEQHCAYQDLDGKDYRALHITGKKNDSPVAYARIFGPGDYFEEVSIGRVIVKKEERGQGFGFLIMEASLKVITDRFGSVPICISAQKYLTKFYNSQGFIEMGNEYLEDGIPHFKMLRK